MKELIAEREFQLGHSISLVEIAEQTGISRGTLSKIANEKGYNTVTGNIDKLCAYFECEVSDLMTYIKEG
ncbi:helix-turn-helix transcriptional regulator [Spongiibacter nanhainus]|uniref:Helix-turn-helix transcriptional regulator n=1 Tax=Spongiibacter nanhainus TaxID=2794344 RepID=A0A7T4QZ07_9GAMM|nr:helix-turn-helix transcriptional regulator [Spongiibacter nanhainus]QQD17294.1 helix-turn-helix transcriptional regulator [Spongiibacter nanhainus]